MGAQLQINGAGDMSYEFLGETSRPAGPCRWKWIHRSYRARRSDLGRDEILHIYQYRDRLPLEKAVQLEAEVILNLHLTLLDVLLNSTPQPIEVVDRVPSNDGPVTDPAQLSPVPS